MKKQPEVTERTRKKLVDAFWSLAREKPISKIAVSELTRRAGCNRSTFYEYFVDTDDLLAYIETEILNDIRQIILQPPPEDKSPQKLFQVIFAAMNEQLYLLTGPNGDSGFFTRMRSELVPLVTDYLPIPIGMPNFDYLVSFVNSATLGLLQHWHDMGQNISTEEICAMMQTLVLRGLLPYISPQEAGQES